jgi:hypothetical protein
MYCTVCDYYACTLIFVLHLHQFQHATMMPRCTSHSTYRCPLLAAHKLDVPQTTACRRFQGSLVGGSVGKVVALVAGVVARLTTPLAPWGGLFCWVVDYVRCVHSAGLKRPHQVWNFLPRGLHRDTFGSACGSQSGSPAPLSLYFTSAMRVCVCARPGSLAAPLAQARIVWAHAQALPHSSVEAKRPCPASPPAQGPTPRWSQLPALSRASELNTGGFFGGGRYGVDGCRFGSIGSRLRSPHPRPFPHVSLSHSQLAWAHSSAPCLSFRITKSDAASARRLKKAWTDIVPIACGPLQVGPRSRTCPHSKHHLLYVEYASPFSSPHSPPSAFSLYILVERPLFPTFPFNHCHIPLTPDRPCAS